MTRNSSAGFAAGVLSACALIAGGLSLSAHAAPPKPPAAPTGTIYYRNAAVYSAVKPDGTGQANDILPNIGALTSPSIPYANPAFSPSGSNATHDRWWIAVAQTGVYDEWVNADGSVVYDAPHWDLFAVRSDSTRSQLITVQLTDLYGIARIIGPGPWWSNDGNNDLLSSFVTNTCLDIRDAFLVEEDGTTVVDATQTQAHNLRFPLTISEIQAGYVPFGPDSWADEGELEAMLFPHTNFIGSAWSDLNGQGKFAPSGNFFLGHTPGTRKVSIMEWTPTSNNELFVLWDGQNGVPTLPRTAQWYPNGQTIVIEDRGQGQPGGGSIYTQPASGASSPKLVLNISVKGQTVTTYSNPIWSPDNKYVVVIKAKYNGNTLDGTWLTRLTLADGKTLDLTPINSGTNILRWAADN